MQINQSKRTWDDYKKTVRPEDPLFAIARDGDCFAFQQNQPSPERINQKNVNGHSALMLAAYHGNFDIVEYALMRGADPNTSDLAGNSALMGAAFKGDLRLLELLIQFGAKVDQKNSKNQTALDFAVMFDKPHIEKYLKSSTNF